MENDLKTVAFRPDEIEGRLLRLLSRKHGLPKTRVLGQALREKAEREGIKFDFGDDKNHPPTKPRPLHRPQRD